MISAYLPSIANHLWQSTLFAALAGGLTLLLRSNGARIRYSLWLAASLKFLLPFALLTSMGSWLPWSHGTGPGTQSSLISIAGQMAVPFGQPGASGLGLQPIAAATNGLHLLLGALAILWVLGTLAVLGRWIVRWVQLRSTLRRATPSSVAFVIPVWSCAAALEPGIVGVLRPVLLLPQGIESRLTAEQLAAVLAHERCHVAWRDNLAAALHMLVEALFWFHPLVWWLGARLVAERERACDEHVLESGHTPGSYAESILKVCEYYLEFHLPCVCGVSGANLSQRIEDIMKNRIVDKLSGIRKLLVMLAAGLTIAIPVAIGALSSPRALAQAGSADVDGPKYRSVSIELTPQDGTSTYRNNFQMGGKVEYVDTTLLNLIKQAYGVSDSQVVGRDWSKEPRYNITVQDPTPQTPGVSGNNQNRAMLRALLTQHFGLVAQVDHKLMDGYVLGISPSGSKLTLMEGPSDQVRFQMTPDRVEVTNLPVSVLVAPLENFLHAPVVDQTGLQGNYRFKATWGNATPGAPPDKAVVARALEEQMGLRLQAKPVSVDVVEIVSLKAPQDAVTKRDAT